MNVLVRDLVTRLVRNAAKVRNVVTRWQRYGYSKDTIKRGDCVEIIDVVVKGKGKG